MNWVVKETAGSGLLLAFFVLGGPGPAGPLSERLECAAIAVPLPLAVLFVYRFCKLLKRLCNGLKSFSPSGLTDLAVLLAGRKRAALRDEWHAHLAGENGHDPVTWRKTREALGFVASAVRFRLTDAAEVAWRPADAVLSSRALSNLFVWGPVIMTLVAINRHDGRFGLVADDQDPAALGAFLYCAIRTGRWWRGVKPPEPKARRAKD